ALAVQMNTSMQGPGQAGPVVALSVATYAAILVCFGLVVGLVGFFSRRSQATFLVHARSAIVGFAGFATGQFTISHFTWRAETSNSNILCSIALGLTLAIAWRVFMGRVRSAKRMGTEPIFVLACAAIAFISIRQNPLGQESEAASPSAPLEVVHGAEGDPSRLMLIGVDGADWARIRPLMAAGRLPNFARLCDGAYQAPLATTRPTWSPIVWTTIATGVREDVHGVLDFTEVALPGLSRGVMRTYPKYRSAPMLPQNVGLAAMFDMLVHRQFVEEFPVTALQRHHKAVWNILSDCGVKTGVVRWWATWPAEKIDGWMYSDNGPLMQAFALTRLENGSVNATTANQTWPLELADESVHMLAEDGEFHSGREDAAEKILAHEIFSGLNEAERTKLRNHPGAMTEFELIVHGDQYTNRRALKLWNEKKVSMLAVYLRAVDNLSHRIGALTGTVDKTYEFTDKLLGDLLDAGGADTTYMLVSDHGWCYTPGRDYGHHQGQSGVIIVKGPGVAANSADLKPSVLDITPTILAFYGLPPSSDMPGKALGGVFSRDSKFAADRKAIASYGAYRPEWPAAKGDTNTAGRKQSVDLLRRLGYL
ncbi:MAG: alkaline phosphatase family protein, partial [Planctomycetota bacterium]